MKPRWSLVADEVRFLGVRVATVDRVAMGCTSLRGVLERGLRLLNEAEATALFEKPQK